MKIADRLLVSALILALAGSIMGQSQEPEGPRDDTVIAEGFRVEGGLLNLSDGDVACLCNGVPIRKVQTGRAFKNGDVVRIGEEGRAEILLDPGYYLRLANNSQARLMDLSPGNLKIKLERGSAILEIAVNDLPDLYRRMLDLFFDLVTVITPRDEYALATGGVYRFNVNADTSSDVKVLNGLVVVAGSRVTKGTIASVRNGQVTLAPLGKTGADAFDTWSRDRAAALVQANKSLQKMSWYKKMQNEKAYITILDPADPARADAMSTISARNGVVSFVEIGALLRSGESAWQELQAGENLSNGDRVRTAAESRAEIHPYPDHKLYLGSNTEMVFLEQADGQVSLTIVKGSAVVIVPDTNSKAKVRNSLTVIAEKAEYRIAERGTYRLNVLSEGKSEMLVYDGAVKVGGGEVKAARRIVRSGAAESELPLDRQAQDSFDIWSNKKNTYSPRSRHRLAFGGLWFLHDLTQQYTFVPSGWNFKSPYGGNYSIKYSPGRMMR